MPGEGWNDRRELGVNGLCVASFAGSGEGEETFQAGSGLRFRGRGGGRRGVHPAFTDCKEEVDGRADARTHSMRRGKCGCTGVHMFTRLASVSCRGRRGSQGSEPYSPYDFTEEQEVPDSEHPFFYPPPRYTPLTQISVGAAAFIFFFFIVMFAALDDLEVKKNIY